MNKDLITLPLVVSQRGRTLIELMVAIALGLLILLGVGALYLGANQSTRTAANTATSEETGQIILATIGNAIRRAGYAEVVGSNWNPSRADLLYSGPAIQGCRQANFVLDGGGNPTLDANGNFVCGAIAAGQPDSLALMFQADNVVASSQSPTSDCLGLTAPMVATTNPDFGNRLVATGGQIPLVRNIYSLDAPAATGLRDLLCRGSGNPTAPAALIGNVEDFKVYFGFDDLGYANPIGRLGNPAARSIRTADEITGMPITNSLYPPWDFVVTVQVCVLIASAEMGVTAQTTTPQYTPCPQTAGEAAGIDAIAPIAAPADGRVRRAYTQTFTVRSRAKPAPLGS